MSDEAEHFEGVMDRQPTLQTVTWLLNLRKFGQLNLDPPYQRRSVWSLRERQKFIDTVLRNYPSPAIFLHVTYDAEGNPMHHVVDGKQRLSAILDFVDNRLRIAKDFGDTRIDGGNWKSLEAYPRIRRSFWTYQLTVEQIDDVNEPLVREIFERLNRNSRKLEPQEMRHARYDGWMIRFLESQANLSAWKKLRVSTNARAKRMADVQMLSEFVQVLIAGDVVGFDQESLDQMYADYEDSEAELISPDPDFIQSRFEALRTYLEDLEEQNGVVSRVASSRNHLYTLWTFVALADTLPDPSEFASRYVDFLDQVEDLKRSQIEEPNRDSARDDRNVALYLRNSIGATTELPQRRARLEALGSYFEAAGTRAQ